MFYKKGFGYTVAQNTTKPTEENTEGMELSYYASVLFVFSSVISVFNLDTKYAS
jgi:hypothetical protein